MTRSRALSLYKSILRAHDRYLPSPAMKLLGDTYVKSEFRLHKSTKPEQVVMFFTEWDKYLEHITRTGRENLSINVGLLDPPPQEQQRYDEQETNQQKQRRNEGGSLFFGKDVSNEVVFNEEQKRQLEKLRDEAAKAAGGK